MRTYRYDGANAVPPKEDQRTRRLSGTSTHQHGLAEGYLPGVEVALQPVEAGLEDSLRACIVKVDGAKLTVRTLHDFHSPKDNLLLAADSELEIDEACIHRVG